MVNDEVNTDALRNAPPLPEVEDSDTETGSEESTSHEGPHLVVQTPNPNPLDTLQMYGIQALLWVQFIWNVLSYISNKTIVVSKSVVRGLQHKSYIFFQGSTYPYRLQDYALSGPGVAPVEWFYDADKKLFLSSALYNTSTEYNTHHFQWLTGEIKYNNLVLYDISEFLEDMKWAGASAPSPSHVLSAWSLYSGIVLNNKDGLVLHTINADGTESNLNLHA